MTKKATIAGIGIVLLLLSVLAWSVLSDPKDAYINEQVRTGHLVYAKHYGRSRDACARIEGVQPVHDMPPDPAYPNKPPPSQFVFVGTICCNGGGDCQINPTDGSYYY